MPSAAMIWGQNAMARPARITMRAAIRVFGPGRLGNIDRRDGRPQASDCLADFRFPEMLLHMTEIVVRLPDERRPDLADRDEAIEAGFFAEGNVGGFIRLNSSAE